MSDITSILLHLDSSTTNRARLLTAQALAQAQGATLQALYAVLPPHMMYPYAFSAEAAVAAQMVLVQEEQRKKQREVFEQLKAAAGTMPQLKWQATTDDPLRGFVQHAWAADLLVLGQPQATDAGFSGVTDDFVPSVLIDTGKPGLVLPYIHSGPLVVNTVLLAWKPSPPSARAAAAALPWLKQAKQVHVATWANRADDDAHVDTKEPPAIEAWLSHHGVRCVMHREAPAKADLGDLMLSLAADVQADLLVMGCYGHSRTREWLLGGATRTVLKSMTVPVLMSH
jgi:nucleotide-binding universal stress UspA family protein